MPFSCSIHTSPLLNFINVPRMEEVSWSDLPQYLLELILKHLTIPDYLRFGRVCTSWHIAQTRCAYPAVSLLPFLMLPMRNGEGSIQFFSLTQKRIYKTPLPDNPPGYSGLLCESSSGGWLLLTAEDENTFLFNPFIKKGKKYVQLPVTENPDLEGKLLFDSCLFFSTPLDPDGVLLIADNCGRHNSFLLCRLKDGRFDHCKWGEGTPTLKSNVIFCEGNLYALKKDLSLAVLDPRFPHNISSMKMRNTHNISRVEMGKSCHYIMVESCGEILLVTIWKKDDSIFFDVFRADMIKMEWVEVKDLGDRTLFLSRTSSISICASENGAKRNCIYYVPNWSDWWSGLYSVFGENNYVEFSLGDLGRDRVAFHSLPLPLFSPEIAFVWVTPCLPY